jgi:hypothetical protein
VRSRLAALVVATGALGACSKNVVYEFPSCVQGSSAVSVLTVPKDYGVSGDRRINERVPPEDPGRVSFFRTYLFTTYPDFAPRATAGEEARARTQQALGDPEIATAWIVHGDALAFHLSRDAQTPREESPDGRYWVYPDRFARAGKPSYDRMNHFLPKETGSNVLITCQDRGDNALPVDGPRCTVESRMLQPPQLACLTVGYRIAPRDLPRWREIDEALKNRVRGFASER